MKKIILALVFIFSLFTISQTFADASASADNIIKESDDIKSMLEKAWEKLNLAKPDLEDWEGLKASGENFANMIHTWIRAIWFYLWIFAVFFLAYAWFLLVTSAWKEEKISRAKTVVLWTLVWFLLVIFAATIVALIIRLFYKF